MSAQPANTAISIYRNVRSFRQNIRHESIGALIKRLRPLIMSVPGHEILMGALSRADGVGAALVTDFSPYCGEARFGAGRGFPIVVGLFQTTTFATAQENLPGVDFAFQIGGDKFLIDTHAALSRDLQGDLGHIWVTGKVYAVGDKVVYNGHDYTCKSAHTAGATFAGDLAAKWTLVS